jgi:hypothetical protein
MMVVATGSVSSDVLLALFLLSLAPFPTDCSKAPITSLRYIALAYSLGQTMGMDTAANMNLGSPWLMHEPWTEPLNNLLLVSLACFSIVYSSHVKVGSNSKSLHYVSPLDLPFPLRATL